MKGCKNCPAYAKCTVTYRGSACAALRGTYGLDSDPEIITNGDRIRAMSDEELAIFLDDLTCNCIDCRDRDGKNENCEINKIGEERFCEPKDILSWLQQPARGDNNETD